MPNTNPHPVYGMCACVAVPFARAHRLDCITWKGHPCTEMSPASTSVNPPSEPRHRLASTLSWSPSEFVGLREYGLDASFTTIHVALHLTVRQPTSTHRQGMFLELLAARSGTAMAPGGSELTYKDVGERGMLVLICSRTCVRSSPTVAMCIGLCPQCFLEHQRPLSRLRACS